jgi:DNA polymerase elongation subunit (family B)
MATLVFDIETSALPAAAFDEAQLEYLFRDAARLEDAPARAARQAEIQQLFSLWPLTAQVLCIAMLNVESARGKVLFQSAEAQEPGSPSGAAGAATPSDVVEFVAYCEEAELLEAFWELVRRYDAVVTFNGRGFDVPFLYLRSAVLNVPITRKDWLGYRYASDPHCDLAEQLTFYGVSGRDGAARRFNLDFYCKVFGIESPKSHGVTGSDVSAMLAAGRQREIAEYCLRDVRATAELYQVWKERLAGIK